MLAELRIFTERSDLTTAQSAYSRRDIERKIVVEYHAMDWLTKDG